MSENPVDSPAAEQPPVDVPSPETPAAAVSHPEIEKTGKKSSTNVDNLPLEDEHASVDLRVKLPVFEGPLDLLLYLIKKDELDIYDIPIERVTRQYLDYLQVMKMLDLEIAGEFLVIASTLLYIKSRTLLPKDQQPPEEEAEEDDPRWDLIRQLVEYKKFKDAAWQLHIKQLDQEKTYQRGAEVMVPEKAAGGATVGEISIFDLINAFQKVLARVSQREDLKEIFEDRFTVSDKINTIQQMMSGKERIFFEDLFIDAASRTEIVVTFLALLELIRMKFLRVLQADPFSEIEISHSHGNTPLFQQTPQERPTSETNAESTPETSAASETESSTESGAPEETETSSDASSEISESEATTTSTDTPEEVESGTDSEVEPAVATQPESPAPVPFDNVPLPEEKPEEDPANPQLPEEKSL